MVAAHERQAASRTFAGESSTVRVDRRRKAEVPQPTFGCHFFRLALRKIGTSLTQRNCLGKNQGQQMTSRQLALLTLLFGAALVAGSSARPGNWEAVAGPQQPVVEASIAAPVSPPVVSPPSEPAKHIRVILPSPYEAR